MKKKLRAKRERLLLEWNNPNQGSWNNRVEANEVSKGFLF
jgi:hypothetical protein